MYNGPTGPIAFLTHVVIRRPIISVAIAALGLHTAVGYVNRTPGGPGIHSGSRSVLQKVEEQLQQDHPEYTQLFPAYRNAFSTAQKMRGETRGTAELSDEAIEEVLTAFNSGLTPRDVRANDTLNTEVRRAYFYELIYRHEGNVRIATIVYANKP